MIVLRNLWTLSHWLAGLSSVTGVLGDTYEGLCCEGWCGKSNICVDVEWIWISQRAKMAAEFFYASQVKNIIYIEFY